MTVLVVLFSLLLLYIATGIGFALYMRFDYVRQPLPLHLWFWAIRTGPLLILWDMLRPKDE